MNSVFELFNHLKQFSTKEAILTKDLEITYEELMDRSGKLACGLRKHIKSGDKIAVWIPNSINWIVIQLAAGLIGATIVPLNMRYKLHEVKYILQNSKCKMLIFQPNIDHYNYSSLVDQLFNSEEAFPFLEYFVSTQEISESIDVNYRLLDSLYEDWDGTLAQFSQLSTPDSAYSILYTSGTTSNPKGAVITQRMTIYHACNVGKFLGIQSKDRFLAHYLFAESLDTILYILRLQLERQSLQLNVIKQKRRGSYWMIINAQSLMGSMECLTH